MNRIGSSAAVKASETGSESGDRKSRRGTGKGRGRERGKKRKKEKDGRERRRRRRVAWRDAARRIGPGTRPCAVPLPHPASSTERPCRGREPINTSARARSAAEAAERGRARPSPGTRRTERPTMGGVAGSVVVREWSPRDVWHRNRECDRGIKSRRFSSLVTRPSPRSLVRPSRARACSLRLPRVRKEEGKEEKREENPESTRDRTAVAARRYRGTQRPFTACPSSARSSDSSRCTDLRTDPRAFTTLFIVQRTISHR